MMKKFFEFPDLPQFNFKFVKSYQQVSYSNAFIAQAIDNSLSVLFCLFFIQSGLSLFNYSGSFTSLLLSAHPVIWITILGSIFFTGFVYRILSLYFLGNTLGTFLLGIQNDTEITPINFLRLLVESTLACMPALWLCDLALRFSSGRGMGMRYLHSYSNDSTV